MERYKHNTISSSSSPIQGPTTFVQADTNSFRELVQKLTGLASNSDKHPVTRLTRLPSKPSIPVDPTAPRRAPFKLQERRHTSKKLEIKLGLTPPPPPPRSSTSHVYCNHSPRQFPSPVTPLSSGYMFFFPSSGTASPSSPALSEEEKAIAEKGFYLHPSPLNTPRGCEPPELLTLFPTSPSQQTRY